MANIPKHIHWKPFLPRTECDTGYVEPCSSKPLPAAFPAEVWREEERPLENLPLLVLVRGSCQNDSWTAFEGEHAITKGKGRGISEYSGMMVLFFAMHSSPCSGSSLEWLHLAVPEMYVSILWKRNGLIYHFIQPVLRKEAAFTCKVLWKDIRDIPVSKTKMHLPLIQLLI